MARKTKKSLRWMRLDNAAKIYPAARRRNWSNVFRQSVTLTEEVDVAVLQSALDVTVKRFPSIAARLRKGAFWYYLQQLEQAPAVQEEYSYPLCYMSNEEMRRCAFRVIAYGDRIAVEFFHSLTDGTGAMVFGGIQPKGENKMVFAGENAAPWAAYAAQIVRVVIEEGVTSIADNAFEECVKLEEVTVAATVEVVGESAFANCESLNEITFQGEAPELGANCFQGVSATVTHPVVDSWKEETLAGTGGEIVLEPAKPKLKAGDANGDGKVDYKDAMLVLRASVNLEKLDEDGKIAGDVDGNGKLDYKDAMKILRASVGLEEL